MAPQIAKAPYKRIATEEAWIMRELLDRYMQFVADGSLKDPGFESLWKHYGSGRSERTREVLDRMLDLGERRIADMDASGIDVQLLLHTAPGVQVLMRRRR